MKKKFRHTDSNLRGPIAYIDQPEKDTSQTFGAHSNTTNADITMNKHKVSFKKNNNDATVDANKKGVSKLDGRSHKASNQDGDEFQGVDFYADPAYESDDTLASKATETTCKSQRDSSSFKAEGNDDNIAGTYENVTADSTYESVDTNLKGLNRTTSKQDNEYESVDNSRKEIPSKNPCNDGTYENMSDIENKQANGITSQSDSTIVSENKSEENETGCRTSDVPHINVNGDLYALPKKG